MGRKTRRERAFEIIRSRERELGIKHKTDIADMVKAAHTTTSQISEDEFWRRWDEIDERVKAISNKDGEDVRLLDDIGAPLYLNPF